MATENIESLDLLSKSDEMKILMIERIKNNIFSFINKQDIILKLAELIDNSKIFKFKSENDKKYLSSKDNLLFVLSVNKDMVLELYNYKLGANNPPIQIPPGSMFTRDDEFIFSLLKTHITDYFTDYLMDKIVIKENFYKLFEGLDIEMNELNIDLLNFMISTMYRMRSDIKTNIVYLEYLL